MAIVSVKACKCNLCGHVWLTKLESGDLPAHCAKCKSVLWNRSVR